MAARAQPACRAVPAAADTAVTWITASGAAAVAITAMAMVAVGTPGPSAESACSQ